MDHVQNFMAIHPLVEIFQSGGPTVRPTTLPSTKAIPIHIDQCGHLSNTVWRIYIYTKVPARKRHLSAVLLRLGVWLIKWLTGFHHPLDNLSHNQKHLIILAGQSTRKKKLQAVSKSVLNLHNANCTIQSDYMYICNVI